MGFIFGLFIGAAIFSGDSSNHQNFPASLGEIPFRCFAAIEQSDNIYRACRRLSMTAQITQQCIAMEGCRGHGIDSGHEVDAALDFEVTALHKLETAIKTAKENTPH